MKKALIVGLNDYDECPLSWCDNDATSIENLLEVNGDGSPNFDCKEIVGSCTKNNLDEAVTELFRGNSDIALLYFSGHGSDADGGYLVTTDFDSRSLGVRMTDVMKWANESKCSNKVIILDCCFSGEMGNSLLTNNRSVLGEGVTIIAASQSDEYSAERDELQHGVFTDLLLQGLQGGAADITGNVTPASLYSFVDQALGPWEQRPVFKTNISQFLPIRSIVPKVSKSLLRKLPELFKSPTDEYQLDPSFEPTNCEEAKHELIKPYAIPSNVEIFKELQKFESVGLVEPVDEDHMYYAAMHNKSCKLTALGLHYWRLARDKRF